MGRISSSSFSIHIKCSQKWPLDVTGSCWTPQSVKYQYCYQLPECLFSRKVIGSEFTTYSFSQGTLATAQEELQRPAQSWVRWRGAWALGKREERVAIILATDLSYLILGWMKVSYSSWLDSTTRNISDSNTAAIIWRRKSRSHSSP